MDTKTSSRAVAERGQRIDTPIGSFLLRSKACVSEAEKPGIEIVDLDGHPIALYHNGIDEAVEHASFVTAHSGDDASLSWDETAEGALVSSSRDFDFVIEISNNVPQCVQLGNARTGKPAPAIFSSRKKAIKALDQQQMMVLRAIMMAA